MLSLAIALSGLYPTASLAQDTMLHRCTGPGGDTIYTDRPCSSLGMAERVQRGVAAPIGARRGGCARTLQDLMQEITIAVDARDVNRLGAVYHWIGHSQQSGYQILDRLQTVVDRPLVDIVPLRPSAVAQDEPVLDPTIVSPASAAAPLRDTTESLGEAVAAARSESARPRSARAPTGLRLEQTLKNGSTPSRTVFGLRRHLDCWWITF